MQRAALERLRTIREWRRRLSLDFDLPAGRFRKGRRAFGCPGRCGHCAAIKPLPSRALQQAEIAWREWLSDY